MDILPFLHDLLPPSWHDRILLVGGTVRDMLLGMAGRDMDLVGAISPDELSAMGFRRVEASSGATVYFRPHPSLGKLEITLIGRMGDLEADLRRRDFTINAMAMDMGGGVIDPLGGRADLETRQLRTCTPRAFQDDPLRIFRAFRFEAGGWLMTAGTEALIRKQEWSASFAAMPVERFSNEMITSLGSRVPERFFERMMEFGVGEGFLPEIFRMPPIPAGPLEHHPEGDLFTHSVQVLQRVAAMTGEPRARFCAFFHDIGKLATAPDLYPRHHGHEDAGFGMAGELCHRLRLPSQWRVALAWTSRLHGTVNRWHELRDTTRLTMAAQAVRAGIREILPLVSGADKPGGMPAPAWASAVDVALMSARELGIDQARLDALAAGDRSAFIMQRRVERLRGSGMRRQGAGP